MTGVEAEAWRSLVFVISNFLGNQASYYEDIVRKLNGFRSKYEHDNTLSPQSPVQIFR